MCNFRQKQTKYGKEMLKIAKDKNIFNKGDVQHEQCFAKLFKKCQHNSWIVK